MLSASLDNYLTKLIADLSNVDTELRILALLFICAIVVLEGARIVARREHTKAGFTPATPAVSLDGSKTQEPRHYYSEKLGLAGRPDALIIEDGFLIPVEHKPLAKKLRDRYVAQLLVYMRLVEECEGTRPPYGYLILGKNCRRFKIENSPARQAWLQSMIDDMRSIMDGAPSVPQPHPSKCRRCDVRASCAHRVDAPSKDEAAVVQISATRKSH